MPHFSTGKKELAEAIRISKSKGFIKRSSDTQKAYRQIKSLFSKVIKNRCTSETACIDNDILSAIIRMINHLQPHSHYRCARVTHNGIRVSYLCHTDGVWSSLFLDVSDYNGEGNVLTQ